MTYHIVINTCELDPRYRVAGIFVNRETARAFALTKNMEEIEALKEQNPHPTWQEYLKAGTIWEDSAIDVTGDKDVLVSDLVEIGKNYKALLKDQIEEA